MCSRQVAIIGAGSSGCICAYFLLNLGIEVTLFDFSSPLLTILPTGGGRCNLAYSEFDFKELAKNYPRGEKFLYSVFSKFSTYDTINLFEQLGIETYTQSDNRIFPVSNSAKEVRDKILHAIQKAELVKEKVIKISELESGYKIKTNHAEYFYSHIVVSTGGGCRFPNLKIENQTLISCTPSLVGLKTDVKFKSGLTLKNVSLKEYKMQGDLLFTHYGISGPLTYKISSLKARDKFPYTLHFDFYPYEFNFQNMLNNNPHMKVKNILSQIFPHSFGEEISGRYANAKACDVDGKIRNSILESIHNFQMTIFAPDKGEETVSAGGYDLDCINSATMESKIHKNLYIIGEALDIDGLCGGFNLQNAWSTAYVASQGIADTFT